MRFCIFTLVLAGGALVASAAEPDASAEKRPQPTLETARLLLEGKRASLRVLQAEILELKKQLGGNQQLLVRLKLLEASPQRFEEAGEEIRFGSADGPPEKLVERWRQRGLVKTLAEPQLVTVVGRPASFRVGGGVSTSLSGESKPVEFGTRVDVLPTRADDGTLRIELRAHYSTLKLRHTDGEDPNVGSLVVQDVNTAANLSPDHTLVVASFSTERSLKKTPTEQSPLNVEGIPANHGNLILLVSVQFVDALEPIGRDGHAGGFAPAEVPHPVDD